MAEATRRVRGVEVPSQEGGGGKMTHELPSAAAKHTGNSGLRVSVSAAFDPPWKELTPSSGTVSMSSSLWSSVELRRQLLRLLRSPALTRLLRSPALARLLRPPGWAGRPR